MRALIPVVVASILAFPALARGQSFPTPGEQGVRLTIPSAEFSIGGPAVEPAQDFPAVFEVSGRAGSGTGTPSAGRVPVEFALYDESGNLLWSELDTASGGNLISDMLRPRSSRPSRVKVPLFIDGSQLPVGVYRLVAGTSGSPERSATATFQMTDREVDEAGKGVRRRLRPGVTTTLAFEDDVVIGGTRLDNLRLAGGVQATFRLSNRGKSSINFEFPDSAAATRKIGFALYDDEGTLVWKSDTSVITLPATVSKELSAGETWERQMFIPLHKDGSALPAGTYTLVAQVDGWPEFSASAAIEFVRRMP